MKKPPVADAVATRSAGVLLHVTSLPGPFGIGDLGPAAHRWIDALAEASQTWWQILPLNPPDSSDSPYSASSAMAGNALLISPEALAGDGLLPREELADVRVKGDGRINFARVRKAKTAMLVRVASRFDAAPRRIRNAYERFTTEEAAWLDDYSLFAALRERTPDVAWTDWPRELVQRKPAAMEAARRDLADVVERHRIAQFLFDRQMRALRAHARSRNVKLLGDVPIYLSHDSADCWAAPQFFQLDARGRPTAVAGVPPDMFSSDGQRWGNPLYDWDAMQADGFQWWIVRLRAALKQADVARIDHFRGLAAYWRIPASAPTAQRGKWVPAPGDAMFRAVCEAFGGLPVVAEDLGVITPDVEELRDSWGLAGMQILQFGFGGDASNTNLPHHGKRNVIVYPGTHDNDTCVGWFRSLDRDTRRQAERYAPGMTDDPAGTMVRLSLATIADRAIIQAQDVLGLNARARMNLPGSSGPKNWTWRMDALAYRDAGWARLAEMTATYGRTRQAS